jgi:hypothetical protein
MFDRAWEQEKANDKEGSVITYRHALQALEVCCYCYCK